MTIPESFAQPELQTDAVLPEAWYRRLHRIRHGSMACVSSAAGSGFTQYQHVRLNRWIPDAVTQPSGQFVFLRDIDDGWLWSATLLPTRHRFEEYRVQVYDQAIEYFQRHKKIESHYRIQIPEPHCLLRQVQLTNRDVRSRRIELTSYEEVVIQAASDFESHPAFSRLFIQTAHDAATDTILCQRRKRDVEDRFPYVAHTGWADHPGTIVQFETDRRKFLGRKRDLVNAAALTSGQPLSGSVGNVLDPIVSQRVHVELKPGQSASFFLLTAVAESADAAVELSRARDDHWLRTAQQADSPIPMEDSRQRRFRDALASDYLFGGRSLEAPDVELKRPDPSQLPDGQVVLAQLSGPKQCQWLPDIGEVVGELQQLDSCLQCVVLVEDQQPSGQQSLLGEVRPLVESFGGLTLDASRMDAGEIAWWHRVARAFVDLAEPSGQRFVAPTVLPGFGQASAVINGKHRKTRVSETNGQPKDSPKTILGNGYGAFSAESLAYRMPLKRAGRKTTRPPAPWTNVVANEKVGFVVSEAGAGFTWFGNSRQFRLTAGSNDPLTDAPSEAIYIRDDDTFGTGEAPRFWSPTLSPRPAEGTYDVEHGFGYTEFRAIVDGLHQRVVQFLPLDAHYKLTVLDVTNTGNVTRRLSVFAYADWLLGSVPGSCAGAVDCQWDSQANAVLARRPSAASPHDRHVAFFADWSEHGPTYHVESKERFLGPLGDLSTPIAVANLAQLQSGGVVKDPCAALQSIVEIAPGEKRRLVYALGVCSDTATLSQHREDWRVETAVDLALDQRTADWETKLDAVQISTPSKPLDVMVNRWLPYQNLSCRMLARSSFYQGGGAFGFRDQLQDAMALVWHDPAITRRQIVRNASHQFEDGDVLHWWHEDLQVGIRTRFSDDLLWLPLVACDYVSSTGDHTIWDQETSYLIGRPLLRGQDERMTKILRSESHGSIYEHCCRAIERSLVWGAHGLPLMGCGDWNDGMNRVGREGRGESVWLGFFLYRVLTRFQQVAKLRRDATRATQYSEAKRRLASSIEKNAWDGDWYVRAFYDNGDPIGSKQSDECQVDALVQAWAVLSGAAPRERARRAVLSAVERLVDTEHGIIRLLTPPFHDTPNDPGYIKGYLPGVRENGGQYTHAALWLIMALAKIGEGRQAAELLEMILPIHRSFDRAAADKYLLEPYVVAADVYGNDPYNGRGGWSWYTGSAGWMFRVALEAILGLRLVQGNALSLSPNVHPDWDSWSIQYRCPTNPGRLEIEFQNPDGRSRGVRWAEIDGNSIDISQGMVVVPFPTEGTSRVKITM